MKGKSTLRLDSAFDTHNTKMSSDVEFLRPDFEQAHHRFGGAAAATPPNQQQRCILTDYFNNYNFSKLK